MTEEEYYDKYYDTEEIYGNIHKALWFSLGALLILLFAGVFFNLFDLRFLEERLFGAELGRWILLTIAFLGMCIFLVSAVQAIHTGCLQVLTKHNWSQKLYIWECDNILKIIFFWFLTICYLLLSLAGMKVIFEIIF